MVDSEKLNQFLEKLFEVKFHELETRIEEIDKRVALAFAASEKAIVKAETATEKRFDGVNEFRGVLSDQATTLLPRIEYQVQHQALNDRLGLLTEIVTKLESRLTGKSEGIGIVGTVVLGCVVGFGTLLGGLAIFSPMFHVISH